MPYQCGNCQSLFLKTLEIRVHATETAMLYKKRCKRCKHKHLLRRNSLQGALLPATATDWRNGRKAQAATQSGPIVSEYTARISRTKEPPLDYLHRVTQAQQQEPH